MLQTNEVSTTFASVPIVLFCLLSLEWLRHFPFIVRLLPAPVISQPLHLHF